MPHINLSLFEKVEDWRESYDEAFRAAIQTGRVSEDETRSMETILAEAREQIEM